MSGTSDSIDAEPQKPSRHMIMWAIVRIFSVTVVLVAVYYQLPLQTGSTAAAITILVIALVLMIGLIAVQVRSILASPFPGIRAAEALATSVPLFLLLFASSYVVMAWLSTTSFSEPLDRTNALYFTVTVFSAVGFGDITAKTHAARLLVTGQMIADLVIIGVAIQVIVGAVKRRRNV